MNLRPTLAALVAPLLLAGAAAAAPAAIDIPYQRFVLPNGLTLIVHEDHKAPVVAVNVWYHVGSKNERLGKTGFAHLFEHLMYNGSEHWNDDFFKALDKIGATDRNGTTNPDRTNYFQNVPVTALDTALFLESDRMGHLLGAVDQKRLDEQRGVVQNEKRQGENQPYGKVWEQVFAAAYPQGHPYSWTTIGSMADLDAAKLEDVHEWFKTYYGAANAVLSIAGDVDTAQVRRQVEAYFGDIPSGPPVARPKVSVAKRSGEQRGTMQDRVPQGRVYKVWNLPQDGDTDIERLELVNALLTDGKTSRLQKRLVYDDRVASDVVGFVNSGEIASQLILWATALPGQDLARVEQAMDEELGRLLAGGPTAGELERVKTKYRADFLRGIERIGGFGGKSDILAASEIYGGSPDFYKVRLERVAAATAAELEQAARRWLADGVYVLAVEPFPEYTTSASTIDRGKLPEPDSFPAPRFPELERATLSNGLKVIVAERRGVPLVNFDLLLDAGYAADHGGVPGTASLTMAMLDEGTASASGLEINERLARLGAQLSTGANLDLAWVSLSALTDKLDPSLEIFTDVVLNPSFPEADFAREKQQRLAAIRREKTTPQLMALRVFPRLLYGSGHAYGMPMTGSGTEESVTGLGREQLREFHRAWFRPGSATLVVVGDVGRDEIVPRLEKLFGGWPAGTAPAKELATVDQRPASAVYLVDRPGSLQSVIYAGHVAPPKANPHETAIEVMNEVLGASFTSRINMNLREDKHWSYGANSRLLDARGQRPFYVVAPVQTDKTKESLAEIRKELTDVVAERPPTDAELRGAKDKRTLTLPGRWETNDAVGAAIAQIVRFGLPDDYWRTYPMEIAGLGLAQVADAAKEVVHPGQVVWVVVGDRAKIEAGIRELGLGEIHFIDADGNPAPERAATEGR